MRTMHLLSSLGELYGYWLFGSYCDGATLLSFCGEIRAYPLVDTLLPALDRIKAVVLYNL